jgi:hypothetical protein
MSGTRFRAGERIKQALAQAKAENLTIREIIIERDRVRLIVGSPSAVDEGADAEAKMEAAMRTQNGSRSN